MRQIFVLTKKGYLQYSKLGEWSGWQTSPEGIGN